MDLVRSTWKILPESVRLRLWAYLARHQIGRIAPTICPLLGHLDVIADAPTEMSLDERLFLYALVRGQRPQRVLEIGISRGGSSAVIASALEDNGSGELVGIDPLPRITLPPAAFHGRFHLLVGTSPDAIGEASTMLGGPFDLILIDGMHTYQHVLRDFAGALPHSTEASFFLFHDAFHFGISEAIRETIEADATLRDCGYVCVTPRRVGDLLTHAGLRLVRRGVAIVDPLPLVAPAWAEVGKQPPHDPDLRNHDIYWCEHVERCSYCARTRGSANPMG
jgi:predicted O-methyltransferase YrrM